MTAPTLERDITIPADGMSLPGDLTVPTDCIGIVIFAHGSGSSRKSPRNRMVAQELVNQNCGTLLFDLLTEAEAADRRNVFDILLLAQRLRAASAYLRTLDATASLPAAYFGASTGAAAALVATAQQTDIVAVVSRGGRPDLAGEFLPQVTCPTLLLVGSFDHPVIEMNRQAQQKLGGESRLDIIDGASHLFEEPGTLEEVARRAATWFVEAFRAQSDTGG